MKNLNSYARYFITNPEGKIVKSLAHGVNVHKVCMDVIPGIDEDNRDFVNVSNMLQLAGLKDYNFMLKRMDIGACYYAEELMDIPGFGDRVHVELLNNFWYFLSRVRIPEGSRVGATVPYKLTVANAAINAMLYNEVGDTYIRSHVRQSGLTTSALLFLMFNGLTDGNRIGDYMSGRTDAETRSYGQKFDELYHYNNHLLRGNIRNIEDLQCFIYDDYEFRPNSLGVGVMRDVDPDVRKIYLSLARHNYDTLINPDNSFGALGYLRAYSEKSNDYYKKPSCLDLSAIECGISDGNYFHQDNGLNPSNIVVQ